MFVLQLNYILFQIYQYIANNTNKENEVELDDANTADVTVAI